MKLTLNLATHTCINRRAVRASYAAAMLLLVSVLVWQITSIRHLQGQGEEVRRHLAELEITSAKVKKNPEIPPERRQQLQEEIAFANDLIEKDGFRWTALLDRLEVLGTDGTVLRSVQPDFKGGKLQVSGLARGVPQLRNYLDRLIASPDFPEVYLLNQANTQVPDGKGGERQAISFSLILKGGF